MTPHIITPEIVFSLHPREGCQWVDWTVTQPRSVAILSDLGERVEVWLRDHAGTLIRLPGCCEDIEISGEMAAVRWAGEVGLTYMRNEMSRLQRPVSVEIVSAE